MVTGFTNSLDEVHRASGDLAALGIQDLEMIMARGRDMQMNWVGLTADTFVSAAYDIRSGISSLTDEGVANVTGTAAIVARATRSEIGTMLLAAGTLISSWAVMSYGATRLALTIGRFGGGLWVNEAVGAVLGFEWSGLFSLDGLAPLGALSPGL